MGALGKEVETEVIAWRLEHPRAMLSEMEAALDGHLDRQGTRRSEDMALASEVADSAQVPMQERPMCPHRRQPLESRGKDPRYLRTVGNQELALERSYGACPTCGEGFRVFRG